MHLINTISRTLFIFLIPATTWIWGLYLSWSSKREHTNASYKCKECSCLHSLHMNGGTPSPTWKAKMAEPTSSHIYNCLTLRQAETSASTGAVNHSHIHNAQHTLVGSRWWPTASSAPVRTGLLSPGFEQHWKNELQELALWGATCQPWQLSCHPQKLLTAGILLWLSVFAPWFQNTLHTYPHRAFNLKSALSYSIAFYKFLRNEANKPARGFLASSVRTHRTTVPDFTLDVTHWHFTSQNPSTFWSSNINGNLSH